MVETARFVGFNLALHAQCQGRHEYQQPFNYGRCENSLADTWEGEWLRAPPGDLPSPENFNSLSFLAAPWKAPSSGIPFVRLTRACSFGRALFPRHLSNRIHDDVLTPQPPEVMLSPAGTSKRLSPKLKRRIWEMTYPYGALKAPK